MINLNQQLTKLSVQFIHESLERDKFMNPTQAMEFGLIDKILEHPPKPGSTAETNSEEEKQ